MGQAAGAARTGLIDGSTNAAWRRAAILAVLALGLVLMLSPGAPHAAGVFAPTVTFQTSTTQSAAHPDARITVDNSASDVDNDLKSLDVQLPDGMWGSLDAAIPCKWDTTPNNATSGTCLPTAKIGTVTASAKLKATPDAADSDMTLSGDLFLTDASTANAATDPAGLTAVIQAKVGGVDLGKVIVHARAIPVYKVLTGTAYNNLPAGTLGPAIALKTVVDDIPNSVTDSHGRTVSFHTTKMIIDLKSDQTPPRQPLLTNQSRCSAAPVLKFAWSAGSYAGGSPQASTQNYTVTNCTATAKGTTAFSVALSNPTVSQTSSAIVDLTLKQNMSTLRKVSVTFPSMIQLNADAYGNGALQQCPNTSIAGVGGVNPVQVFNPQDCPNMARFGTIKIWTPLLPQPVIGYTYWVTASPIPAIGVWISPTTDLGNPKGITLSMVGQPEVPKTPLDPSPCNDPVAAACDQALTVTFDGLPSAPVSRIQMNTYRADRPTLSKDVFTIASAADPRCQKTSDVRGRFSYYSSASLAEEFGEIASTPISVPGCNQPDPAFVTSPSSPIGTRTTDTTPTFEFGTDVFGYCADDYMSHYAECTSTYDPPSALGVGLHHFFFAPDGGNEFVRAFVVDPPEQETTAPTVAFDSGPSGDTSDSTPSFAFHADESSLFQCSLDSGAFLPCTSTTSLGTSSTYDVASALFASDDDHTLSVRATDSFGNLGSAVTRTFKIVIPFDPSFSAEVSTTTARAHPTLDVTVASLSHEDLDKLTLSLPDGFLGSLRGAVQCNKDVAKAGNCGPESQVGTVETEAAIDRSIARVNGTVYLTGPQVDGDPAGISVKVPAKIQDVDLGNIIVPIRLTVRGQVKGIDSVAIDIPHQINPALSGNNFDSITQFDMRSIKLKLRNNNTASQPLLTNPSSCAPTAFKANYIGTAATVVNKTQAFEASNCGALGLAPTFALSLVDSKTGKAPAESTPVELINGKLTADLTTDPNGSGISSTTLLLPKAVTVAPSKLPPVCTVEQYDLGGAAGCPAASIVGDAMADSPLLLEPLKGSVYLVKSNVKSIQLPRLLIALRGKINTDIFGNMEFENSDPNNARIKTTFPELPDAPISTFHINVDKVISTRPNACQFPDSQGIAETHFAGYSGAASTAANFLPITCNGSGEGKFKNKRSKSTLSLRLLSPEGTKFKKISSIKLPKGLKFTKKGFKKGLSIKSGSKKLKYSCFKSGGSNKITSKTLCKKYAQAVTLTFKAGTLSATKKVKKPKISVTATDSVGRTYTFVIQTR